MNKDLLRIKIAEHFGAKWWKHGRDLDSYLLPESQSWEGQKNCYQVDRPEDLDSPLIFIEYSIPNYPEDLNSMRIAAQSLAYTDFHLYSRYSNYLEAFCKNDQNSYLCYADASAELRASAFVEALGL